MTKPLPHYIQPKRFAEQITTLKGSLKVSSFPRLLDLVYDSEGIVNVELNFDQDEQHIAYIRGQLETTLHLQCQRCMESMDYLLHTAVSLSPVFSEAASKALPEQYDPLLLEEDKLILVDLVEDELLLNLPLVPKHDVCNAP